MFQATRNLRRRGIQQSRLETQRSPSVPTGESSPSVAGMEGTSMPRIRRNTSTYRVVRSVRLFSARTFKPLGTLAYHRQTCHTISFPHSQSSRKSAKQADTSDEASVIDVVQEDEGDSSSDDDHDSARRGGKEDVMRWMVTGGKDRRVALWQLKDFSRR